MTVKPMLPFLFATLAVTANVSACDNRKTGTPGGGGEAGDAPIVVRDHILQADPFILLHEGTYYAYGTGSRSDTGVEVYYTDDPTLTDWKKHPQLVLYEDDSYADRWFWAPEVRYVESEKKFYMYYSADEHICVATATSPLGPFRQTVEEPMRAEKSIDSSLFVDDDGRAYLYFVRFTGGNVIWMAELEDDLVTIRENTLRECLRAGEPWETVQANVAEGPSVVKADGLYYLIYSANHYQSRDYAVGYATAPTPAGPWTKASESPILRRPDARLVGTGHGAPFTDADGKLKYVFHAHSSTMAVQPRKMYIADMTVGGGRVTIDAGTIVFPREVW